MAVLRVNIPQTVVPLTVDVVINPSVNFVDLRLVCFWINVDCCPFFRYKVIKSDVENADDFRRFVIHDDIQFLVPKDGNREP